jgi:hypothetical protein
VVRPGGGRSPNGQAKRTIWRLVIPTLRELPNPSTVNNITRFSTGFAQSIHNGDRSITVNSDRLSTVNGDRTITQAPDQRLDAAASCPVENAPIRPVRTPSNKDHPSSTEKNLFSEVDHEQADRELRQQHLEHLRMVMARADVPRAKRRRG